MSKMPQSPRGLLPPLSSLVSQKKVSPTEMRCEARRELCSVPSKPESVTLNGFVDSSVLHAKEEMTSAFVEDAKKVKRKMKSPLQSYIMLSEENLLKEKQDSVMPSGDRQQYSFTKPPQKGEPLLRSAQNPGLEWILKQKSEEHFLAVDTDYSVIGPDNLTVLVSARLAQVEQCIPGLKTCLVIAQQPVTGARHCYTKLISPDVSVGIDFCYHPAYVKISKHFGNLQASLKYQAHLKLASDFTRCMKNTSDFLKKISMLLQKKQLLLKTLTQNFKRGAMCADASDLKGLCEELSTHIRHWRSLCWRMQNDNWLRPMLPNELNSLAHLKEWSSLLTCQAIFLMKQYLHTLLSILAYVNPLDTTSEIFVDFFQSIEIYNNVLSGKNIDPSFCFKECDQLLSRDKSNQDLFYVKDMLKQDLEQRISEPYSVKKLLLIFGRQKGRLTARHFYSYLIEHSMLLSSLENSNMLNLEWEHLKVPFVECNRSSTSKLNTKEINTKLLRPKLGDNQQTSRQTDIKNVLGENYKEYVKVMDMFLRTLISSNNALCCHILNKPKPDKLPLAEYFREKNCTSPWEDLTDTGSHSSAFCQNAPYWQNMHDLEMKELLLSECSSMMWKAFGCHLLDLLFYPNCILTCEYGGALGSLYQSRDYITQVILHILNDICNRGKLDSLSKKVVDIYVLVLSTFQDCLYIY
ncbi:uncharacterized protein LOC122794131 [Protopterus annectens]|uniref:uncharacterized protein LOC122794131 n=1 Tax=Protopterus annectens TaxID=7888 RepID=UPI001CFA8FF0|nr:uncharacterized protein LOC122794131 [Protopterus annectens]